jgi:hypothetical protein
MAKKVRILLLLSWLAGPGAVLAAGCESPPEERCAVREGEASLDTEEGFEKRSPRGRTP